MADGSELLLGLTGWPLEMTLSPLIHRIFLETASVSGEYRPYPLEPESFEEGMNRLGALGVKGLNVTYPYKHRAAVFCDELEGDASELGTVNTVSWTGGRTVGWNTDTVGLDRMLSGIDVGNAVHIVGAGGAAMAAGLVFSRMDIPCTAYARSPGGRTGPVPVRPVPQLPKELRGGPGTVVNATTLGWDDDDGFPLDAEDLAGYTFIDLNYNPSWRWRNGLSGIASSVFTGETMLVFQAAESFRIWTGETPSVVDALLAVFKASENNWTEG